MKNVMIGGRLDRSYLLFLDMNHVSRCMLCITSDGLVDRIVRESGIR